MTKTETTTAANLGFEDKLWADADMLRGNMDAAEYEHVVLVTCPGFSSSCYESTIVVSFLPHLRHPLAAKATAADLQRQW